MDFDTEGNAVALEILNASKVLKVSKHSLTNIGPIHMEISVNERLISLKLCICVLIHNKKLTKSVDGTAINEQNLPNNQIELASA